MKVVSIAKIIKNIQIAEQIYDMTLLSLEIAKAAVAGQFVEVYTGLEGNLLPRPLSICEYNKEMGTIRLVYQVVGKGTEYFSRLHEGDVVKIIGPLGNGFQVTGDKKKHLIIGGGIGIPPLLQLAKIVRGEVIVCLGSRSKSVLVQEFKKITDQVYVASEDDSAQFQGNVIQLLEKNNILGDIIYACGPKKMLQAVSYYGATHAIPVQVSMEERMACGIGACVGCAIKILKKNDETWSHLKVCKDGPVFDGSEVIWND